MPHRDRAECRNLGAVSLEEGLVECLERLLHEARERCRGGQSAGIAVVVKMEREKGRKVGQTRSFRGSKRRNKVSLGGSIGGVDLQALRVGERMREYCWLVGLGRGDVGLG
jgi:hypothetical protein